LKPYERYLIWATVIFFVTAGLVSLVMSPLSEWRRNPLFWLLLMGLCIAVIIMILEVWDQRRKLRWLLVPPVAVLVYGAWFFLKAVARSILQEVIRPIYDTVSRTPAITAVGWLIFLIGFIITLCLLGRIDEYKERLERVEEELKRRPSHCPHCGAQL
jgi:hypothetical protein